MSSCTAATAGCSVASELPASTIVDDADSARCSSEPMRACMARRSASSCVASSLSAAFSSAAFVAAASWSATRRATSVACCTRAAWRIESLRSGASACAGVLLPRRRSSSSSSSLVARSGGGVGSRAAHAARRHWRDATSAVSSAFDAFSAAPMAVTVCCCPDGKWKRGMAERRAPGEHPRSRPDCAFGNLLWGV